MKKRNERRLAIVLAMMMIFMNFIITPVMADGDVAINEDNFPDENFRSYVSRKTIDKDENGILSKSELEAVTVIGVQREEISNLKGIEYFTELKKLYCLENKLTELDVKSNTKLTYLECNKNQLTNLDLSKNTELTYINCSKNQLTALDLSNNTKLTYINCSENQLTTLNLGNNTNLITLYCHHNQLTALDLSKSTRLGALYCNNNQLTNLALTNTVNLTTIQCSNNQLTNLALTNTTSLKFLDCQQNQLTTLALTNTTSLITLYCQQNQLTALNLTNNTNLEDLYCDQNQLTTLDLSKNTNLKLVDCDQNQLTTLDLSHNIKLEAFSCDKNQLSELDLTNNTNLEELDCGQNKLTTLDLSKNTELTSIHCSQNKLTTLDLKNNTKLKTLYCAQNQLTDLDLSNNTELTYIFCSMNDLTTLDLENNTKLKDLYCNDNKLTNLDLSHNSEDIRLNGSNQKYDIKVNASTLKFDLQSLPGNFNPSMASDWDGGTVDGNILTINDASTTKVKYIYKVNNGDKKINVTLNVKYGDVVTVTFNKNGKGGDPATIVKTIDKGSKVEKPSNPTDEQFDFDGWYTEAECTNKFDFTQKVNANITLYANWTKKTYKLTASVDGGHGSVDPTNETKNAGETVTLTFAPDAGYEIEEVKVNDVVTPVSGNTLTLTMDGNKTVVVKYKKTPTTQYTLNASVIGGNGSVSPTTKTVDKDETVEVTFTPETGYEIEEVKVNDVVTPVSGNTLTLTMDGNKTVVVKYKKTPATQYTLNASVIAGQGVVGPTNATRNAGEAVTLTFVPYPGYELEEVKVNDVVTPVSRNTLTLTMDENKTVVVKFKPTGTTPEPPIPPTTKYTLTASVIAGQGVVGPTNATRNAGEEVTLTFVPYPGYELEEVKVNDVVTAVSGNTLTLTMDENKTVVVKYKKTPATQYTLNASVDGGHGSVDPTNETKNAGETVTLTFAPETGYEIEEVKVNDVVTPVSGNTLVLTMNENKTVVVKFKVTGTTPTPEPPTPTPTPTPTPDPYYPGYDDWYVPYRPYDYYDYYRPHRPHRPSKPAEEKAEEKPIDKPANKIETEVILVIGSNNLDTKINGTDSFKGMDVAPYIKNGRTMLPIRYVAEALGMSVSWDAKTRTVIIQDMFYTVEIPVDTNKIIVNGVEHISDVKPEIKNARTMLPIANIARALGLKDGKDILWDAAKKQVTIIRTISR